MNEKKELKREYRQYEHGSFIAQFELAIAPIRDQITRVEDTHAAIKKELKAIRLAIAESNRIARTATVKAVKAGKPVAKPKKLKVKEMEFYADIVTHLREHFRQVEKVEKPVLLAGGGMTVNNFRAYLAMNFDSRMASDTYISNYNLHIIVKDAGLGQVFKHTLIDRQGKDKLFLFYKFEAKQQ